MVSNSSKPQTEPSKSTIAKLDVTVTKTKIRHTTEQLNLKIYHKERYSIWAMKDKSCENKKWQFGRDDSNTKTPVPGNNTFCLANIFNYK